MVRKEIHCHLIGYNIVRAAIVASCLKFWAMSLTLNFHRLDAGNRRTRVLLAAAIRTPASAVAESS